LWENWYQVAGRFDASNVYLFVNGVQVASAALGGTITKSAAEITIGSNTNSAPNEFYDGSIALPLVYYTYKDDAAMLALGTARQPNNYDDTGMQVGIPLNKGVSSGLEAQNVISANGDAILIGSPEYNGEPIIFDSVPQEPPVEPPEASYNMFDFNGSTEYITVPNPSLTGSFTFAAVMNTTSSSVGSIIRKDSGGHYDHALVSSWTSLDAGAAGKATFGILCTGGWQYIISSTTVNDGSTHSIIGQYDSTVGSNGEIKLFIDGVEEGSLTLATSRRQGGSPSTNIGIYNSGANEIFTGNLSSVGVYDSILTASERSAYLQSGKIVYPETFSAAQIAKAHCLYEMSSRDNTLNDISGNGNNGTAVGGVTSDGALQTFAPYDPTAEASYNMFDFNGSTEYITVPNPSLTGSFTFAAVMNTTSSSVGSIIRKDSGGHYDHALVSSWTSLDAGAAGKATFGILCTGGWQYIISSTTVNDGSTHSIIGQYDSTVGSNGEIKLFIDGVEEGSLTLATSRRQGGSPSTNIGIYNSGANEIFTGNLSSVGVYDSILTASERSAYLQSGKIVYPETFSAAQIAKAHCLYEMSSRDNTLNDISGNGNNGTAVGGVTSDGALQTFAAYT